MLIFALFHHYHSAIFFYIFFVFISSLVFSGLSTLFSFTTLNNFLSYYFEMLHFSTFYVPLFNY